MLRTTPNFNAQAARNAFFFFSPSSLDLQLVRKQCLYNQDRDLAQGVQAFLTSRLAFGSILQCHQNQN